MRRAAAILFLGALLGCHAQPAIDASSDETLKASFAKMMEGMSSDEAKKLNDALKVVMMSSMSEVTFADAQKDPSLVTQHARQAVQGKTAADVLAEAERIRGVGAGS